MGHLRHKLQRKSLRRKAHLQPKADEEQLTTHQPDIGRMVQRSPELMGKPENILQLQSQIGNQATMRMLNQQGGNTTIQRMPTRNQALNAVGAPSGAKSKSTARFILFLSKLNTLNQYILNTTLGTDRNTIMAQFMIMKGFHDDIATAAENYYDNLGHFKKKSTRAQYVKGMISQAQAEQAHLVPVMFNLMDSIGFYHAPPKLFVAIAQNKKAGQATEVNKANRTDTKGGAMNEVGFHNEGVFKAPNVKLSDESLSSSDNDKALTEGMGMGMSAGASDNEYNLVGQALGLRNKDSLAHREVAMSYLDRLLGANMLTKTEKALERDGMDVKEGVIMENLQGPQMATWLQTDGNDAKINVIMRDLSKLQLLDLLALQVDRHGGNYVVQTDTSGRVIGLKGFDHDLSFGRKGDWDDYTHEIPGLAKYVDKELAQRIITLNPEMLKWVMEGLLAPDVIDYLLERLDKLKAHLLQHQDKWLNPNEWDQVMNRPDFKSDKSYINKRDFK